VPASAFPYSNQFQYLDLYVPSSICFPFLCFDSLKSVPVSVWVISIRRARSSCNTSIHSVLIEGLVSLFAGKQRAHLIIQSYRRHLSLTIVNNKIAFIPNNSSLEDSRLHFAHCVFSVCGSAKLHYMGKSSTKPIRLFRCAGLSFVRVV
jgi:hypothetical protein